MRGLCQEDVRIIVQVLAERLQDVLQVSKKSRRKRKPVPPELKQIIVQLEEEGRYAMKAAKYLISFKATAYTDKASYMPL